MTAAQLDARHRSNGQETNKPWGKTNCSREKGERSKRNVLHYKSTEAARDEGTYSISEGKAAVAEFEVLQQGVELVAIDGAPRTEEVVARFGLLAGVVIVNELVEHALLLFRFLVALRLVRARAQVIRLSGRCSNRM